LPAVAERGHRRSILVYGFAFVALVAGVTSLIGIAREPWIDPDSCIPSKNNGCVHGTIADEHGKPVKEIEVEVLSAEKTGDARWYSRKYVRTDSNGRYSLNELEPGAYLIAVHYYDAPNARQPFATAIYPGAETESKAERVVVHPNSRAILKQLRLRSLPLTTIEIKVLWSDGTRPERSDLSFHNLSYPSQGGIGDVVPQVDDGRGDFTLPEGFDYTAIASVDCIAGHVIESRESRPVQEIAVRAGTTPRKLTFTIPGPPCKLWDPK
jgi:hypothetical protein